MNIICTTLAVSSLLISGASATSLMTEEHIEKLQAYDYTQPQLAVSYEEAKTRYSASTLNFLYSDRSGFEDFTAAREHLYNTMSRINTYHFPAFGVTLTGASNESFFEHVIDEAIAEVSYESERLTVIFHADESCLYQADTMDRITATVRGTAEVRLHVKPTELKAAETGLLCKLGFTQLYQGQTMYIDVDVHMNTQPVYNVNIHTIVPLSEAY